MALNKKLYACLLSATLLSGCSMFGGESDIVKKSPVPPIQNKFEPKQIWNTSVGKGTNNMFSSLHPTYHNGVVYAASRDGIVEALNLTDGKTIWRIDLAEKSGFLSKSNSAYLSGGVTVEGDTLYIGSEKAKLYAINTKDGSLRWQIDVDGEVLVDPVVHNNLVLLNTSNGVVQAINKNNGKGVWELPLGVQALSIRGDSAPIVVRNESVLVGNSNGRVINISLDEGLIVWQQYIAQPGGSNEIDRLSDVNSTPVVDEDRVYAVAYNGYLVAMDLQSGRVLWRESVGSIKDLVIDNNNIYLVDKNDNIMAIRSQDGVTVWKQTKLAHRLLSAPAIYNGYVVVGDSEGYAYWLDKKEGHFFAHKKVTRSALLSKPIVAGKYLFIQAENGKIYSYQG